MSVDGALECALLAAAIKTVCQASQPRRTILGVAASVASALMRPRDVAVHGKVAAVPARTPAQVVDNSDTAVLLDSLRAARRAQRIRKKERRRVAKQAAEAQRQSTPDDHQSSNVGAAGQCADLGGDSVAEPALAPEVGSVAGSPTQQEPSNNQRPSPDGAGALDACSSASGTLRAPSLSCASSGTLRAPKPQASTGTLAQASPAAAPQPQRGRGKSFAGQRR